MIPKIIHYCWLSNDPIPNTSQRCVDSWREKLPDYEFKKWDFTKFDKDSSIWVREAFENKKYATACDYIRLYAVYHEGGIYMDMDVEVVRSFDPLLSQSRMFATENPKDPLVIEAGCFGAEPGDIFIEKCLEYYKDRHYVKPDESFDTLPLPQIMKRVILDNNLSVSTYTWDYFTCKSYKTGKITTTDNTYAIHHFAGSWLSEEQQAINELTRKLSKYCGHFIAHNISEFSFAFKQGKAVDLLREKIQRKIQGREKTIGS